MKDQTLSERIFGQIELCSAAIEFNGVKYTPDSSKAYGTFRCATAFPSITAYGTCFHPTTVANSFNSMRHQVLDYDHQLKAHDKSKDKREIREDHNIGTVLDVTYPTAPTSGWAVGADKDKAPCIQGIYVMHKKIGKAAQVLSEHLTGKHKWTVSIEMEYSLLGSGFVVGDRDKATKAQKALMAQDTPDDLDRLGMGYVMVENAPEDLLSAFNIKKRKIDGKWGNLPVSFMKGGINGETHFAGLGVVRYGAEREAEILQILASDPDRLGEMTAEELGLTALRPLVSGFTELAEFFKQR